MEAYFVSTLLVALAEMGDRTQLLAIMLASRYRKPIPILLGIFVATLANHSLAALAGFYLSSLLSSVWFKYLVAASFIVMALWALVPDKEDERQAQPAAHGRLPDHGGHVLPGRDGRQDPDRHRGAGGALPRRADRRGRHHHRHDAGQHPGGVPRPRRDPGAADPRAADRRRPALSGPRRLGDRDHSR